MNDTIKERIQTLRAWMKQTGIEAFIIPSTDPHLSEYVAPHWQSREWISGFTGSAGTVVVTENEAGLWTDSRYFLQAAQQLEGTDIDLYKEMLPETPSIPAFLSEQLKKGTKCRHRRQGIRYRRSPITPKRTGKQRNNTQMHR